MASDLAVAPRDLDTVRVPHEYAKRGVRFGIASVSHPTEPFYGIFDQASGQLLERFALSSAGWNAAVTRLTRLEGGGAASSAASSLPRKECPQCYQLLDDRARVCPHCRWDFEHRSLSPDPRSRRPATLTGVAVILIVLGGLVGLGGMAELANVDALSGLGFGVLGATVAMIALVMVAFGGLQLWAGIEILGLRERGARLGRACALAGLILSAIGVIASFTSGQRFDFTTGSVRSSVSPSDLVFALIFGGLYGFVLRGLRGEWHRFTE